MHIITKYLSLLLQNYFLLILVFLFNITTSITLLAQNIDSSIFFQQIENLNFNQKKDLDEYLNIIRKQDNHNEQVAQFILPSQKQALASAQAQQLDSLILYLSKGISFHYFGVDVNLDSCIYYNNIRLEAAQKIQSNLQIGRALNLLGVAYSGQGKTSTAIKYWLQAFDLLKLEGSAMTSFPLSNLAWEYYDLGDFLTAQQYVLLSIPYAKKFTSPDLEYALSSKQTVLSRIFHKKQQKDSAIYCIKQSLALVAAIENINDNRYRQRVMTVYENAAFIYMQYNQLEEAKRCLDIGLEQRRLVGLKTIPWLQLSYYLLKNDLEQAKKFVLSLDQIKEFEEIQFSDKIIYLQKIASYYQQVNNSTLEARFLTEAIKLTNEYYEKNRIEYTAVANVKFQSEQKQERIRRLEQNNQVQHQRHKLLSYLFILATIIIAVSFYTIHISKGKNNLLKQDLEKKKIIEQQANKLKELYQQKSRFFTNIAHELRTPLHLILAPIQTVLQQNLLTDTNRQHLELVHKSTLRLLSLTNQVLDLIKGEEEKINTNYESLDLLSFLEKIKHNFQHLAQSQQINFKYKNQFTEDINYISTDINKLEAILTNLLGNAINFTPPTGSINFSVDNDETHLYFSIQNTGDGILPEDLPYIFDHYYQGSKKNYATNQGTGIGLSICQFYVKLLDGAIKVTNQVNEGVQFQVSLPLLKITEDTSLVTYSIPKQNTTPSHRRLNIYTEHILVVEDDLDMCKFIELSLEKHYALTFVHNGQQALEVLETLQPQLIITDLIMPVMNGMQLIKKLKNIEQLAAIPILVLTAKSTLTAQNNAIRVGVDDYLTKPFEKTTLIAHLKHLLNNARQRIDEQFTDPNRPYQKEQKKYALKKEDQLWLEELEIFILPRISNFDLQVGDVAQHMEISIPTLNKRLKLLTGMTPKQYIQEIRFLTAREMLIQRKYNSVKAVSYSVGFKSDKNFSRNFKKRFGNYPSKFL